ncbi:MAG: hypothetical protein LBU74_03330 [Methanobacteriaceae archaeon]|jgi:CRISPR-associated protein Csh1|nr:hypothetical protein [Candidatus Methanorudis spinitermitis]
MIKDLVEFGRWIYENNQDDLWKNSVKNEDFILPITYKNDEFILGDLNRIEDCDFKYFDNSLYHDNLLFSGDQKVTIANINGLMGLTPFFVKLDHKFLSKTDLKNFDFNRDCLSQLNKNKCKNFEKSKKKLRDKIERTKEGNEKNKQFNQYLDFICQNGGNDFLQHLPKNKIKDFECFFNQYSEEFIKDIINKYHAFLLDNVTEIINKILEFKKSDEYKEGNNFYLNCIFGSNLDFINDLFITYTKLFKNVNTQIKDYEDGICSICGNKAITYPSLGNYSIKLPAYSFNHVADVKNTKLRLCKECNSYIRSAEYKLKNILPNNMIIIPKPKNTENYDEFLKIGNLEDSSFKKINNFLNTNNKNFNHDLLIYNINNNLIYIQRYIENYRAFLVKFDNIQLYNNTSLNYLFGEKYFKQDKDKSFINNTFDLEAVFKDLFIDIKDKQVKYPNLYHFYQIYINSKDILKGFDSKTTAIFAKYMHDIFNFVYEVNFNALSKDMTNEIVLNSLIKLQRNTSVKNYDCHIRKRLNYYFMFKIEFLEDTMQRENLSSLTNLKKIFEKYHKEDKTKKIDDEDIQKIMNYINEDVSLKYYLIGQFIALIDKSKGRSDKKSETFSNFVINVNRNNLSKFFTTEILQKNILYINQMNKKGKFIFKLFETNSNSLFNEKNSFSFEDYLLLLFTGYYTENILSSSYGYVKKENEGE